ncbi:MAG: hypothetical protein HRT45_18380 [Bdellovibrionales bacterium]|nr:hypothetical protein [Bdellovibrionales bacterium]
MRPVSRIMATITAQFDQLVNQIENHEAVAEASLRQLRQDISGARVQYKMMQKDIESLVSQQQRLEKDLSTWQARAVQYSETDKEKALHCMRKIKLVEKDLEQLAERQSQLEEAADKLQSQLTRVESQYKDLSAKLQAFRGRDKAAAMATSAMEQADYTDSIDDVFNRWDRKILYKEVSTDFDSDQIVDEIEQEFKTEEELKDLEMSLRQLVDAKTTDSN